MPLMKTPRMADIVITNRCNLRCRYCLHFESARDSGRDLPASQWLDFFGELGRSSVMSVRLSGGEPFIREDFGEIISGIVKNRMRFSILTNATLITDESAEFMASTGRCDSIQVSIDGSVPATHDTCRGEGSFERVIKGVGHLKRHKLPLTVRVTIHRHNVSDLESLAKFLLEDIGLPDFSTNSTNYLGRCRKNADQLMLTTAERSQAMETLLMLEKKYPGRISATAGPLSEAKFWPEMVKAKKEGKGCMSGKGCLSSCNGPMSEIGVRADGVIVPCIQLGHMELGRINEDDLGVIWREHPLLNKFRERNRTALKEFEFCRGCEYIDYCSGGCPAAAYTMLGDENQPSPDGCLRKFLSDGGRLPMELLSKEACL